MSYDPDDTIVAVASAAGGSARAIVRASGPRLLDCLAHCFEPSRPISLHALTSPTWISGAIPFDSQSSPHPPPATRHPPPIPRSVPAVLFFWPNARSYTRQPMAEIHTFGAPPLVEGVIRAVCRHGARLAEPGEFTLRAFLAGRIDLTQAEGVLGVIDSTDGRELNVALAQLAGGLRGRLAMLREQLLDLLAELEAGLDFVEEDIEFISPAELASRLGDAQAVVSALAEQVTSRTHAGGGLRVVLCGAPNVGKSSLFNALAAGSGQTPALVSNLPGTTRDWLCAPLAIDGLECRLIDTAGNEPLGTGPAAAAQGLKDEQLRTAHLILFCLDSTRPPDVWERAALAAECSVGRIVVLTKIDSLPGGGVRPDGWGLDLGLPLVRTSAATSAGLAELKACIRQQAISAGPPPGVVAVTATRCRESIRLASESLARALTLVAHSCGEELVAAEVRETLTELGKVVGAVYTDDILDRIFSRFCIGK